MGELPVCPVCGDALAAQAAVGCAKCETPHHRDCFRYSGSCAVYGCGEQRFTSYSEKGVTTLGTLAGVLAGSPLRTSQKARPDAKIPRPGSLELSEVPVDRLTSAELLFWPPAALCFLAAIGCTIMSKYPGPFGVVGQLPAALAAIGGIVFLFFAAGIDEFYVVGADSLDWVRGFYGFAKRYTTSPIRNFAAVGVATRRATTMTALMTPVHFRLHWVVLVRPSGRMKPLGEPMGAPGYDAGDDAMRTARRIAQLTGLELRDELPAPARWRWPLVLRSLARRVYWMALAFTIAAAAKHVDPTEVLPEPALVYAFGFVFAIWSYYWLVARPLGPPQPPEGGENPAWIAGHWLGAILLGYLTLWALIDLSEPQMKRILMGRFDFSIDPTPPTVIFVAALALQYSCALALERLRRLAG